MTGKDLSMSLNCSSLSLRVAGNQTPHWIKWGFKERKHV
jgi:hypothetical protein